MKLFNKSKIEEGNGMYGISISREGFCVAKTSCSIGEKPELEICDYSPWAQGVPDEKQVKEKIKELDLAAYACTTVLDIDDYDLLNVEAPEVPEEEVVSAVRWRISDMVDFDISDAVIDVFESPVTGGQDNPDNIYVVAASHETIQQRVSLLQNAQVQLSTIDIPELVLCNLASLLPENEEGIAFLYMMRRQGVMVLIRDSYVYIARRLDIGLEDLIQVNEGSDQQEPPLIQEANPQLESLVLEMLRTIDYYDRYFSLTPLSGLVITPMGAELPGFQQALTRMLGFNVRYLDMNELLDCKTPMSKALQEESFLAIGATLRIEQEESDEEQGQGEEEFEVARG
ncbi:MAG: hypothetical protein KAS48_05505 [Gammaproteobacteria bacterium]|nr:hypothetical protein [Gammaproteobacteria bacterium]